MIVVFATFLLILLFYNNFFKSKFNSKYLSKENTTRINGFFIMIVFFAHFEQYITITSPYDAMVYKIIGLLGQLIVTTFFFFSGYGIFESVKNKKGYVKNFFRNRFIPTYTNWFLIITAFLVVNIILGNILTIPQIILSYVGWESIGNSNWYLFDIFVLYILFIISFNLFKKENLRICSITILTILFISILTLLKDNYCWYNTLLCFPLGMIYSYYKEKIDAKVMKNNKTYYSYFIITLILFIVSYLTYHIVHIDIFNIVSCFFVLTLTLFLMKFELKSQILYWCGKNLFWIYTLQRIPMMIFEGKFSNYNIYFIVCLLTTIMIVYSINFIKQRKAHPEGIRKN